MALQLSLTGLQQDNCSEWVLTDSTGVYAASGNPDGWAIASALGGNLVIDNGAVTYAELTIAFPSEGSVTIDIIDKYPNKPWNWDYISCNPNIIMDMIEKYPDKPWNWHYISSNRNITMDFINKYPNKPLTLEDVAHFATNNNAFWIINHPLCPNGLSEPEIEKARELGATGIEYNSFPVLLYGNAFAIAYSRKHNFPLIAGDDAHSPEQIGNCFVSFAQKDFNLNATVQEIQKRLHNQQYTNHLHYMSLPSFLRMVKEHIPVEGKSTIDFTQLDRTLNIEA